MMTIAHVQRCVELSVVSILVVQDARLDIGLSVPIGVVKNR